MESLASFSVWHSISRICSIPSTLRNWFYKLHNWFYKFMYLIGLQYLLQDMVLNPRHEACCEGCCCRRKQCGCCCLFWLMIFFIFGCLVNLFSAVVFLLSWAECPIQYYGICYNIEFHSDHSDRARIPDLILKDLEQSQYINESTTKVKLQQFEDFSKLVLLFSTSSSFFSFFFFAIALWRLHYKQYKIKFCVSPISPIPLPLDPFNNEDRSETGRIEFLRNDQMGHSTKISKKAFRRFILPNTIGLVLFVSMVIAFLCGQYRHETKLIDADVDDKKNRTIFYMKFEISAVVACLWSFFCTLMSCFIFSKLMLAIQDRCSDQKNYIDYMNLELKYSADRVNRTLRSYMEQDDRNLTDLSTLDDDEIHLSYLKEVDKRFVRVSVSTLEWFQLWFFLHWLFHMFSALLSISLFLNAFVLHIKAKLPHLDPGVDFEATEIMFLFTFSAFHSFLVLYPCFQAAAVTHTREALIRSVSKKIDEYRKINNEVKKAYITYMSDQKFGFRISIFCRSIPFNLNIAYISIGLALLGVVISLLSSL